MGNHQELALVHLEKWLHQTATEVKQSPVIYHIWIPLDSEVVVAERFITFIENRRVLYELAMNEVSGFVKDSVFEIRNFLESELLNLRRETELAKSLRAIQSACREFLTQVQFSDWRIEHEALLNLRAVCFLHIARILIAYKIDADSEVIESLIQFKVSDPAKQELLKKSLVEPLFKCNDN